MNKKWVIIMIDTLDGLLNKIVTIGERYSSNTNRQKVTLKNENITGQMYCVQCGGIRKMKIINLYKNKHLDDRYIEQLGVSYEINKKFEIDRFVESVK
ncbi:hypothetical protein [Paenibacillus naphthalenovorans]|uniref:hypothetical protein n=1 Tax=Paenibacillus naphthalenovorans TaxID=162209 RepID=UPI003D2DE456